MNGTRTEFLALAQRFSFNKIAKIVEIRSGSKIELNDFEQGIFLVSIHTVVPVDGPFCHFYGLETGA